MRARFSLAFALVLAAEADAQEDNQSGLRVSGEPSHQLAAEEMQAQPSSVRVMPGIGVAGLFSPSFGFGLSAGLAVEKSRFLVLGEALVGAGSGINWFFGGAGGLLLRDAKITPYGLMGIGWLGVSNGDRSHDIIALTLEGGFAPTPRRRPQIWIGVRGFIPLVQGTNTRPTGSDSPSVPFLSINFRLWI